MKPKIWQGADDEYFLNDIDAPMMIDSNDNLWYIGKYGHIYIYNSYGISGMSKIKGKYTKVEF